MDGNNLKQTSKQDSSALHLGFRGLKLFAILEYQNIRRTQDVPDNVKVKAAEIFSKNCIEIKDSPVEKSMLVDGFLLSQCPSTKNSISLKQSQSPNGVTRHTCSRFLVWTAMKNDESDEENTIHFNHNSSGNTYFL